MFPSACSHIRIPSHVVLEEGERRHVKDVLVRVLLICLHVTVQKDVALDVKYYLIYHGAIDL